MYAVIRIAGHQYRVSAGDTLVVDRLSAGVGETVQFPALLVADGTSVKLGAEAGQVAVFVTVVDHGQGEKIHVRRFRGKSRYRKHVGFRPQLTTVKIAAIGKEVRQKEAKSAAASIKPKRSRTTKKS